MAEMPSPSIAITKADFDAVEIALWEAMRRGDDNEARLFSLGFRMREALGVTAGPQMQDGVKEAKLKRKD